ncbi:MAG: TlyA family RNA methyltransferase [Candidatus Sericytochromatia bacterium]|nr:TlyA family RNA methyltransferase [Candidatus Sericytochromatia bacterium]
MAGAGRRGGDAPAGAKRRLDQLLVERGLYGSRERAQAAIMAGLVKVGGQVATKAGLPVGPEAAVEVAGEAHPYVSRGGLKLERALAAFGVDPAGRVVLDAGASTGGFTDLCLQRGARRVYAVDVGYGQLAWSLRQDPRVVVMERTNVRHLTAEALEEPPSLIVADLSFISLDKVLPAFVALLAPGGEAITLIKPQFEVGKGQTDGGVVRAPRAHRDVLARVVGQAAALGWGLVGLTASPIKGPEGNIEFLAHWRPGPGVAVDLDAVVAAAHAPPVAPPSATGETGGTPPERS